MKVKITKCSKPRYWYNDKVGKIFEVCEENDTVFITKDSASAIDKSDCELIPEGETTFGNIWVGARLYSSVWGCGDVKETSLKEPGYPIGMKFDNGVEWCYSFDGTDSKKRKSNSLLERNQI